MLSPNDVAPKSKAASIWSFDSGYGSNTLEDDEVFQVDVLGGSATQLTSHPKQQPIGLGIGGMWDVYIEDQLRLRRSESTIEPVTTKLNVFTTSISSNPDFVLPALSNSQNSCVECQLWDITNPGENLKCDGCRDEVLVAPQALHCFDNKQKEKLGVPRLDIPHSSDSKALRIRKPTNLCTACEVSRLIDPTKRSTCSSCAPDPAFLSPISPVQKSMVKRSCARRPNKLPPRALQRLQFWLQENRNNPYPDADTKRLLAHDCGITERQVNTWFTNARARKMSSPDDRSNSVSDDEANYESGFSSVTSTPIFSDTPFTYGMPSKRRRSDTSAPHTNSLNPADNSTSRRGKKKDYSCMNTVSPTDNKLLPIPPIPVVAPTSHNSNEPKTWQCTFCYRHVAPKSWRRHEETQHRPKRKWTCLLTGPRLTFPSRANAPTACAFCMIENPSEEHFEQSHRITECMEKSEHERTFLRPDHLRQHVTNFHKASLWDIVRDTWKIDGPKKDEIERFTCGFCGIQLNTWDHRETHITGHFKAGLTMAVWRAPEQSRELIPGPSAAESRKRRNSSDLYPNVFVKLARTFTGRSIREQTLRQSNSQFLNAFEPFPVSSDSSLSAMSLLPDRVFDQFMLECGNQFDSTYPSTSFAPEQHFSPSNVYNSTPYEQQDTNFDFDTLTGTCLNNDVIDYQGIWDQQQQQQQ